MSWSIVLCEGAHEEVALSNIITVLTHWEPFEGHPDELPEALRVVYPEPMVPKIRWASRWSHPSVGPSTYLRRDNDWLEIKSLQGVTSVLGTIGTRFMESVPDGALRGFGALVDADEVEVQERAQAFSATYGELFPQTANILAGQVVAGPPRVGLWVAPNNLDGGSFDRILVESCRQIRPDVVQRAEAYVDSVTAGWTTWRRDKAVLGAIAQKDQPGASLWVAMSKVPARWFSAGLADVPEVEAVAGFVAALCD